MNIHSNHDIGNNQPEKDIKQRSQLKQRKEKSHQENN